ncbi:RelA/SpoT family protein [Sphingomonas sp. PP-CE-3G-477]|uniref:GTP pyrophosphokinase n=1 Tax=Sphingomonas sp. PP-CE-3G-477 TaxID=2135660 RepID=UPI000D4A686B|nr:RelA/SpoT domain-containing protein [Sphingomonas sp. PP-CE-3G-477]PTQ63370.1 RelA/SpoT family protein [Sphingomonas sp. PP-CE-3G-477]
MDADHCSRHDPEPRLSRDEQFLARWDAERSSYEAWGNCITDTVKAALEPRVAPDAVDYFLKAHSAPRAKADQKLLEKAFYRNKGYHDPYTDITDKVGTRFVVLLGSDIAKVVDALESVPGWTKSKDRDYEAEQKRNPIAFDYAAVHFVVRPSSSIEYQGVKILADTPCEVQIKTILQHAYSELTHDTIYKPQIQATPTMQRDAAKAMALLEATNDYFEKVSNQVAAAVNAVREITNSLSAIYRSSTGLEPSPSLLEGLLLEAYEKSAGDDYLDRAARMLDEKPFLVDRIKERVARRNPLFSQPSVLLAYLDIMRRGRRAIPAWPLTEDEMEPLLNDLGESRH